MLNLILTIAVIILSLLVGFLAAGWFYAARLIDRLTDKILSKDYSDYRYGETIKNPEWDERNISQSWNDKEEAKLEEERNKTLIKHAGKLGEDIEKTMGL